MMTATGLRNAMVAVRRRHSDIHFEILPEPLTPCAAFVAVGAMIPAERKMVSRSLSLYMELSDFEAALDVLAQECRTSRPLTRDEAEEYGLLRPAVHP